MEDFSKGIRQNSRYNGVPESRRPKAASSSTSPTARKANLYEDEVKNTLQELDQKHKDTYGRVAADTVYCHFLNYRELP